MGWRPCAGSSIEINFGPKPEDIREPPRGLSWHMELTQSKTPDPWALSQSIGASRANVNARIEPWPTANLRLSDFVGDHTDH